MSNYNVDLMLDVRNMIAMHPEQHRQKQWSSNHDSNPVTDCGTVACVAGWAIGLLGMTLNQAQEMGPVSTVARKALGLDLAEATNLFLHTVDADNPEAAALAMLDDFIEKGKRQ